MKSPMMRKHKNGNGNNKRLEAPLLVAVEGDDLSPLAGADFEQIKERGLHRLMDKALKG